MNKKGQSTIEFALAAVAFFVFVFALADFCLMFYVQLTMQHAVREGARKAITGEAGGGNRRAALIQTIREFSSGLYDKNGYSRRDPTVSVVDPTSAVFSSYSVPDTGRPNEIITVSLTYTWALVTPVLRPFFPNGTYTFTVKTTMKNEPWGGVMRSKIFRRPGCKGQSLVELALVLPLLVALVLGVVDFSRAIQAHNAIVNMSREGANLASRTMLMQQDRGAQMIMNSLANTAVALSMAGNGTMYLTQVQGTGGTPTLTTTSWEQNRNGPPSAVNARSLPGLLGDISLNSGDTVYIFEIFYKYQSMFVQSYAPQLHSVAIFRGGS